MSLESHGRQHAVSICAASKVLLICIASCSLSLSRVCNRSDDGQGTELRCHYVCLRICRHSHIAGAEFQPHISGRKEFAWSPTMPLLPPKLNGNSKMTTSPLSLINHDAVEPIRSHIN
ncbi:hypothetical protein CONLIGDRAFT_140968 [Coniochaeta ligniaria NRRL 30616]|uniref:Uncharacterized protein n=1 Tax=Coniochaeta ligniaria NRRL 30616 TaxID=1408157 RepID=A0A1J7J3F6_9PEZI|nr:hypothetical protein CONLIGDRAFT_140968 [Coniochaeta ligniaria NRRL 30616]